MKTHVVARAKLIKTQNLAPDVSLAHVMKLLKEYIWQFKQIFFHFGVQSLVEVRVSLSLWSLLSQWYSVTICSTRWQVDSKVTVDMKEFLCFARAFGATHVCLDQLEQLSLIHGR